MKIFFDTSILIPALIPYHPEHSRPKGWLQNIQKGQFSGVISTHILAEVYTNLTRYPIQPKMSPQESGEIIDDEILAHFELVPLDTQDYLAVIRHLADSNLSGAVTYDALHLHAAQKAQVDQILTFNKRDFERIYPNLISKIIIP